MAFNYFCRIREMLVVVLMFSIVLFSNVFKASGQGPTKCYDPFNRTLRCMPDFENAAFTKIVKSNNTCGSPPSEFCFQTTVTSPTKECELCSANDTRYSHPSIYITDIKNDKNFTWWQSDTLLNNPERKIVTLTLELEKSFDVTYIRIRFRSPRPESMAIYKRTSYDPKAPWVPYQYFSASCNRTFGLPNTPYGLDEASRDQQKAMCTNEFSSISPLTGGNIAFSTLEGRPGAEDFDNSPTLQEWVTATAIRIDLVRMNTFGDEVFGDPNVLKSYYFAIFDLAVGGRCKCNGHASACRRRFNEDKSGEVLRCECQHNTDGVDCEKCLPMFNDRKWARATEDDANECLPCNCNNKAERCVFDQDLFDRTGHGGRCIDCKQNTAGVNCEICKDNFYRGSANEPCRVCNCNPTGSASLQCDSQGRCICKPGVTGEKCDRCLPNFFGFSQGGCSRCQCSLFGTDPNNAQCNEKGECFCKRNVIGASCDQCRVGYYGLEETNPYGCKQCFCSGHTSVCQAAQGYAAFNLTTSFAIGLEGWTVQNEDSQDVTPQRGKHVNNGQFFQATAVGVETIYAVAPSLFLGNRRSSYAHLFGFFFRVGTTEGMNFRFGDIVLEGANGLKVSAILTAQNNPIPTTTFQKYSYRLHEDAGFGWQPQLDGFEFQKLLTTLQNIKIRMNYADQGTGILDDVFLEVAVYDPSSQKQVNWVEECVCPPPYRGTFCENCQEGYTRQNGVSNRFDLCIPCDCHNHADTCHPDTGVCNCTDNTAGKKCDRCVDGYYGNPTHGTPNDCKPCNCYFASRCLQIGAQVICTDCPEGHSGNDCGQCTDGYYGDPKGLLGRPTKCQKCNCSGNIDANAVGNCNPVTGDCLKCIHNTKNGPLQRCEECQDGYYGNATAYPKPPCIACMCYPPGTATPPGHRSSDPLPCDAMGRCTCLLNVVGDKCDSCAPGFWNVASGKGCEQCRCSPLGSTGNICSVQTGQCPCKPGITGRQCDVCKPDHYQYSVTGCTPCNCNPEGSLNVSCDENGKCTCRPGVLGVKCDMCQENHHNLSAGCVRCPPCYDDVQTLVNNLRIKIRELVYIIDNWNTSGKVVVDVNFENKLRELSRAIERLVKQAEQANKTDIAIQEQIKVLLKRVEGVKMKAVEAWSKSKVAELSSQEGISNLTHAGESLNRTREMLDRMAALIMVDGMKALNESILSANSTGDLAKRLAEMAAEARELANKHEHEADKIEETVHGALNNSKKATEVTRDAVLALNKTYIDLADILRRLRKVELLSQMTQANATSTKERAENSLSDAENIFKNATAPFPDIGLDELRRNATQIEAEARNKTEKADMIMAELDVLVASFNVKEDDVRRKMAMWSDLMAKLRNLTDQVQLANLTAHAAVKKGEDTLKKAFNLLELLEGFNQQIARSKNESEEAKKLIPEIERLIESANNKTRNASAELGDAQRIASESEALANSSQETADRAKQKAQVIKRQAEELTLPIDNVTEPVNTAKLQMDGYKRKANDTFSLAISANSTVQEATQSSRRAIVKIEDVLKKLQDLLAKLDDLGQIDWRQLENLEAVLRNASAEGNDAFGKVSELTERQEVIVKSVAQYTLDLEELKKQIKWSKSIYESLPTICPKTLTCDEGDTNC